METRVLAVKERSDNPKVADTVVALAESYDTAVALCKVRNGRLSDSMPTERFYVSTIAYRR